MCGLKKKALKVSYRSCRDLVTLSRLFLVFSERIVTLLWRLVICFRGWCLDRDTSVVVCFLVLGF